MAKSEFRDSFGERMFYHKYSFGNNDTWANLARRMVEDVCGGKNPLLSLEDRKELEHIIRSFKFIPGGRYLYYAGRSAHFWNNCYLLKAEEDTREEWAEVAKRTTSCLMSGGGIGVDYSILRPSGLALSRTGGISSGPISLMKIVNEIGRNVMQGGTRRSAMYASLNWQHEDVPQFLIAKNWKHMPIGAQKFWEEDRPYTFWDAKQDDFNFPCPLDMTNISLNYDDTWLKFINQGLLPEIYLKNVRQALETGEPGFSFNFGKHSNETLRNACTEVTSEDDSDVCNLGSINLGNIETVDEFRFVTSLASKFLVCGTVRADLPYRKIRMVREKNRRLGLGLMGIHEWLIKRGYRYEVTDELHKWLEVYKNESERTARESCSERSISTPKAFRSIAPTGTIGILAGTSTGIEPIYAVAYKRRYLKNGTRWYYRYVIDSTAETLINSGVDPYSIETAYDLANDPERRIKFQYDVQQYVDMAISSTINLPAWGTPENNEDKVLPFALLLAKYASGLRGFTCYPDGSRGGQPLTEVDYYLAKGKTDVEYEENTVCLGGVCGI